MLGPARQHGTIERLRFGQAALAMQPHPLLHELCSSRALLRGGRFRCHSIRLDTEAAWGLPAAINLPHRSVGRFEVAAEPFQVEQRTASIVFCELAPNRCELCAI